MQSTVKWCLFFMLNVLAIDRCLCHPTGAPVSVCHDLMPKHKASPQTSSSPFTLTARTLNASHLELVIEASDETAFKGFVIQAKRANASHEAIGRFVTSDANAKTINCYNQHDNTITHTNRNDKKKLIINWIVPKDLETDTQVIFVGTVVKDVKTFWTELTSEPVKVSGHGSGAYDQKEKKDVNTNNLHSTASNKSMDYLMVSAVFLLFYRKI